MTDPTAGFTRRQQSDTGGFFRRIAAGPQEDKSIEEGEPSAPGLAQFFRSMIEGVKETGLGAAQLGARVLPGEMGKSARAGIDKLVTEGEQQFQGRPETAAHPWATGLGRAAGGMLATAPLGIGAGAATPLGRIAAGAGSGLLGAAAAPVIDNDDFWTQKSKQLAVGALMGGTLGGAMAGLAPRGAAAQMAGAGVPLTAGMQLGMRPMESALAAFPVLGTMVRRGEAKSIDGFDRAVVNQALEPIGETVPRNMVAGHGLVQMAQDKLSAAYDKVLPNVSFSETEWHNLLNSPQAQQVISELPADQAHLLNNLLNNRVTSRFKNGILDGQAFKKAEAELSGKAASFGRGTYEANLGEAIHDIIDMMRSSLVQQNPDHARELQNVNYAWAMFSRVRNAAGGADAAGRFSPTDLLRAARRLDLSPGRGSFARGDALLQAFGEAGDKTFGKIASPGATIPSRSLSGLRTLLELGGAGGAVGFAAGGRPGMAAGAMSAALPYAARGAMSGAAAMGKVPQAAQPGIAAAAGRESAEARSKKRLDAASKIGEIQSQRAKALRISDLDTVKRLGNDLAEAQAEYRRLGGGQ